MKDIPIPYITLGHHMQHEHICTHTYTQEWAHSQINSHACSCKPYHKTHPKHTLR